MPRSQHADGLACALLLLAFGPVACSRGGPDPRANAPAPSDRLQSDATIVVDASITFQTITGWEGGIAEARGFVESLEALREPFLDALIDLGINRVRVEVRSGIEHDRDNWSDWQGKRLGKDDPWWKSVMYETVNDNEDPFSIDRSGFHFADLDFDIEHVVNPLRGRLAARGESLFVNFTYVAFVRSGGASFDYVHRNPEEYAEFVLAAYQHMQQKYGWVPNSWEVILEPDAASSWTLLRHLRGAAYWEGHDIGLAIVAAGQRLKAAGFTPRFVAPSTLNTANAARFFDEAIGVPGTLDYLGEVSYHRYSDASADAVAAIGARAQRFGIDSAMLENIAAGHEQLHEDLTLGRNSAWAQYRLAAVGTKDAGGVYFGVDAADPHHPKLVMGARTRFLRQYFRYIRRGARRVGTTSSNAAFEPIAFVNADGGFVVVVKADTGGAFAVNGLPPGSYGIAYSTRTDYDVRLPAVRIDRNLALSTSIPAAGVLTLYATDARTAAATPSPGNVR